MDGRNALGRSPSQPNINALCALHIPPQVCSLAQADERMTSYKAHMFGVCMRKSMVTHIILVVPRKLKYGFR